MADLTGAAGDEPLVSVIVPTYNRVHYLQEAVDSVLGQTYHNWELIVVDDGSTDATASRLRDLGDRRLRVVHLEHSGRPARVRNEGLACARGAYVAFLDSDDLWCAANLNDRWRRCATTRSAGGVTRTRS